MKKRYIVLLILSISANPMALVSINLKKLGLQKVHVTNSSNNQVQATVHYSEQCSHCKSINTNKKKLSLERNQTTPVAIPEGFITNLTTDTTLQSYTYSDKDGCHVELRNTLRTTSSSPSFAERSFDSSDMLQENSGYYDCLNNVHDSYQALIPAEYKASQVLQLFKANYEKNRLSRIITKNVNHPSSKIPHIIHQNWFGVTGDIPPLYKQWRKEWKKNHPGWKVICWNEAMIKQHFPNGLYNQKTFDAAKKIRNYAKMSDVARYEIIEKFGGLYIDCDTKCLEPFHELHQNYDFVGSLEIITHGLTCANCVFTAKPHHPIIKNCIKNIKHYELNPPDLSKFKPIFEYYESLDMRKTLLTTGPGLITKSILEGMNQENNVDIILPNIFFCPGSSKFYLETFSFHDFACPVKQNHEHWVQIVRENR